MSIQATHSVPAAMSPGLIILILSLLLELQPITTDLYLPALPALTEGFGAPMAQAQLAAQPEPDYQVIRSISVSVGDR